MATISLEDAQAHLSELIASLQPGEVITITLNQQPIARLSAEQLPTRSPRKSGSAKGLLKIVVEDDEHLEDFAEYMK